MWCYLTKTLFCIFGRQPRSPEVVEEEVVVVLGAGEGLTRVCASIHRGASAGVGPDGGRAAELSSESPCREHPCG